MKNAFLKPLLFGVIFFAGVATISAQESTTLQFMKEVPQSDLHNPALHNNSSSVVVGLPGLSGLYCDFNSGFAVNDLIHKGTGALSDSLVLDINGFHNSLKKTNTLEQHLSIPLFYLGIRNKKSFYSLGISDNAVAQFSFAKSFVTFLKDGNSPYMGKIFDLGNIGVKAFYYREFVLGYSNELISDKLTVGLKAKLLYGKFALQTERLNQNVETAPDGSYLNLKSDMKINLSAPVTLEYDSDGYYSGMNSDNLKAKDYMLEKGNVGVAFDLGAVYKLTPQITLTGSIVDIGRISFKSNVHNLNHVSTYRWDGIDFSQSVGDTAAVGYVRPSDLVDDEMEKLKNSFKPQKNEFNSDAFDLSIPMKIYFGGTYKINDVLDIGLLNRLYKNGDFSQNTLTISANALFGDFFSLTGSYSMIGGSYDNLGLGMAVRLGFAQLYLVNDNILALADPAKAEYTNIRFGLNFLFGRKYTLAD